MCLKRVFDIQLSNSLSTQLLPAFTASPGVLRTRRDLQCLLSPRRPAVTLRQLQIHFPLSLTLLPMLYSVLQTERTTASVCTALSQLSGTNIWSPTRSANSLYNFAAPLGPCAKIFLLRQIDTSMLLLKAHTPLALWTKVQLQIPLDELFHSP